MLRCGLKAASPAPQSKDSEDKQFARRAEMQFEHGHFYDVTVKNDVQQSTTTHHKAKCTAIEGSRIEFNEGAIKIDTASPDFVSARMSKRQNGDLPIIQVDLENGIRIID